MSDRYRDRPFPPDNNFGRGPNGNFAQEESDPLAELARLIGQADPFSNFGRDYQKAPAQHTTAEPSPAGHDRSRDHGHYENPGDHDHSYYESDYASQQDELPVYEEELPPGPPSWMRHAAPVPQPEPRYADDHEQALQRDTVAQSFSRNTNYRLGHEQSVFEQNQQYEDSGLEQEFAYQADARQSHPAESRYDDVLYGEPAQQQTEYYGYDQNYQDQDFDQQYPQEPPPKRKSGMMTVAVVLALAVLGTAGAYAYRSLVGSPRSGEPPVIKADSGPNKIVPNNQSANGKQIYDRVGDSGSGEKVVSREEQPVNVDARAPAGPRVVFPPLTQNATPPAPGSVAPDTRPTGPGVANGTLNGEVPRAVKTLTIRPDQPDSSAPATTATAAIPAQVPAQQPQQAARASSTSAGAPLALAPQAASPAAAEPRSRVASLNPNTTAPSASGAFVQVSSQRSEADALSSYKVLQSKYSGILGSRQATVRRADLGEKGVYYRALIGPFAGTEEATQFCVNLQSAGGKCIVQRN